MMMMMVSRVRCCRRRWSPLPPLPPASARIPPFGLAADAKEEAEKLLRWQLLWKKVEVEGVEAQQQQAAAVDEEEQEAAAKQLRSPPIDASDACSTADDTADTILEAIAERQWLLERAAAVAASILNSKGNRPIEKEEANSFLFFLLSI